MVIMGMSIFSLARVRAIHVKSTVCKVVHPTKRSFNCIGLAHSTYLCSFVKRVHAYLGTGVL